MDYKKYAMKITRQLDYGIKQIILNRQDDDNMGIGKTERIDRDEERENNYDREIYNMGE